MVTTRPSTTDLARRPRPRAHEYVADQLRREIRLGIVLRGEVFPPERELARMLRVGRSTVQQALGILQHEGLVERRVGRNGGTFVIGTAADVAEPGTVRTRLLPSSDIVREALDFRFAVEPAACGLAARCATAQDLETIKSQATAIVRAQDDREFNEHNASLHAAIGVASHNRFYAMALKQIQYVVDEINEVLPDSPAWHDSALTEHAAIVEAIVAGSEQKAVEAMRVHIERTDVAARAVLEAMHRERR